jgi:hypothetical protein
MAKKDHYLPIKRGKTYRTDELLPISLLQLPEMHINSLKIQNPEPKVRINLREMQSALKDTAKQRSPDVKPHKGEERLIEVSSGLQKQ